MTTPRPVDEGNEPKEPTVWTYDAIIAATEGLAGLSKIGSKNRDVVKKLAKLMLWSKKVAQEFFIQRDTLTNAWAERDESGEIVVKRSEDGQSQMPVMRNGIEHQLQINELLRGPASFQGEPPEPLTEADLDKFMRWPDAITIANLGPFVKI